MVAPFIVPVEQYIDCRTPILHKCLKHDYEWHGSPDNILRGTKCPICASEAIIAKNTKSFDQYVDELAIANTNIICIGGYTRATEYARHKCLIDGYEWDALPSQILGGRGCPKCGKTLQPTQDEFLERVASVNPDVEVLGQYVDVRTPVKCRCKIDGNIWEPVPSSLYAGCGCPQCKTSHGEREVLQWIQQHDIDYVPQKKFDKCRDINPLPFDFYLPDYNIVIEFDGEQHYRPIDFFGGEEGFQNRIKHDKIKTEFCKLNAIKLIRIPFNCNVSNTLSEQFTNLT